MTTNYLRPAGQPPNSGVDVTDLAPVALFAWQRPSHTERVLCSLAANTEARQTDVLAFIDGPRHAREAERVDQVIDLVGSAASEFRSLSIQVSPENKGLSRAITSGVTHVLWDYERVIVVEDDIVVSRSFLAYMNDHLDLYADSPSVASIHGYIYPHSFDLPTTFFIAGADCWGWATWRRAWEHYRSDGSALLQELTKRDLLATFDFGGTAGYVDMLRDQIAGRNDSWAVRWYASTFLDGMFTLYPGRSLATNIGGDGSGNHGGLSGAFDVEISHDPVPPVRIPIEESLTGRAAFSEFFASQRFRVGPALLDQLARRILRRVWIRLPVRVRSLVLARSRTKRV